MMRENENEKIRVLQGSDVARLEMLCFTWSNFTVRVLALVLSLSYLGTVWTSVFVAIALILAAVLLHHSTVPARFQTFTTWAVSLTTTTLVVENISLRERGRDRTSSGILRAPIKGPFRAWKPPLHLSNMP
jgi:hypothetical protein